MAVEFFMFHGTSDGTKNRADRKAPKNTIIPRSIITLSRQMTFFGDRRFFYGISSTHPCTKELNERNVSATSNEIVLFSPAVRGFGI